MKTLTNETTSLPCAVCHREAAEPVVCHHCGRPLCARCRRAWRDTAFAGSDELPPAFHCAACWRRYHLSGHDLALMLATQIDLNTRSVNRRLRRGR